MFLQNTDSRYDLLQPTVWFLSDRVSSQKLFDWVRKRCFSLKYLVLSAGTRLETSCLIYPCGNTVWTLVCGCGSISLQGGDDGADCSFKRPPLLLPINTWRSARRSKCFSGVRLAVCWIKGSWAWQKPDTEVDDVWNHVALFNFSSHTHAGGLHHHVPPETRRRRHRRQPPVSIINRQHDVTCD